MAPKILKTDDWPENFFSIGILLLQRFQQTVTLDSAWRTRGFAPGMGQKRGVNLATEEELLAFRATPSREPEEWRKRRKFRMAGFAVRARFSAR
jgi:hypothetical protein